MKWQKKANEKNEAALNAKIHTRKKFITSSLGFLLLFLVNFFVRSNMFLFACFFSALNERTDEWKEWRKTKKKGTTNCIHIGWEEPSHAIILFVKVLDVQTSPIQPRRTERATSEAEKSCAFIKQVWIWCVKWMWEIDSCQVQLMPLKVFLSASQRTAAQQQQRWEKKGREKKTKTIPLSGMLTNFSGSGNTFASLNCTASNLI